MTYTRKKRDAETALPRKFIIARWSYPDVREGREWEGDPIRENSYDTRERLIREVWFGDVVPLSQAVEIDLIAGTARDITAEILADVGEHSFVENEAPHAELAAVLDAAGVEYLTEDQIEAEFVAHMRWQRSMSRDAAQLGVGR
jgi:hypothetical protein